MGEEGPGRAVAARASRGGRHVRRARASTEEELAVTARAVHASEQEEERAVVKRAPGCGHCVHRGC
eukprot:2054136-Rhodomonas_salina.2